MKKLDADIIRLDNIEALLEWDQETYMPRSAQNGRAAQLALLAALRQERIISSEWETLFGKIGYDSSAVESEEIRFKNEEFNEMDRAFLREVHRRWLRNKLLPVKLVKAVASEISLAQSAWAEARSANDFQLFAPHLEKVINLKREYALTIAPDAEPYDTLLDEYEPGADVAQISDIFDELGAGIQRLMDKIKGSTDGLNSPMPPFLDRKYSVEKQDSFGRRIQSHMGFDTNRGRLDQSLHPFATSIGLNDIRLTTCYDEKKVLSALFSNIHEAGHGLYEQGMDENLRQTILGDGASFGIHESQSSFWDSIVGKSHAFWSFWYPEFQKLFSENLVDVELEEFYRAINIVKPSLIRVDSDEITYSLHIVIRFQLEQALISGELEVSDLPGAWNQSYRELIGVSSDNDSEGCMQDIHWSGGSFGYFPTYTLGKLYSAQFISPMEKEVGFLADILKRGELDVILQWLRENIHRHGRVYRPTDLCHRLSNKSLGSSDFLSYLDSKYKEIYRF